MILLLASQLTADQERAAAIDLAVYAIVLVLVAIIGPIALMAAWDWWRAGPCPYVLPVIEGGEPCHCTRHAGHKGDHRHGPWTDSTPVT